MYWNGIYDHASLTRVIRKIATAVPRTRLIALRISTSQFPTLNGCLPGQILDLISKECVMPGEEINPVKVDANNLEFVFDESVSGVDLNGDGDIEDSLKAVPIVWHKAFTAGFRLRRAPLITTVAG